MEYFPHQNLPISELVKKQSLSDNIELRELASRIDMVIEDAEQAEEARTYAEQELEELHDALCEIREYLLDSDSISRIDYKKLMSIIYNHI